MSSFVGVFDRSAGEMAMLGSFRFVNLLLVALTFGLTWCHVMEIPGKRRLSGPEWLSV
jgi:hypothetical protein